MNKSSKVEKIIELESPETEDSKIKVEREIVHEENISELEKRKVVDFLNKSIDLKYEEVRDKYYSPSSRL